MVLPLWSDSYRLRASSSVAFRYSQVHHTALSFETGASFMGYDIYGVMRHGMRQDTNNGLYE